MVGGCVGLGFEVMVFLFIDGKCMLIVLFGQGNILTFFGFFFLLLISFQTLKADRGEV